MDDQKPHKIRVPIQPLTPIKQVEIVLAKGDFLAFARILGLRIMRGKAESALKMLRSIGATGAIAYQIIEGWAAAEDNHAASPLLTPPELGAVYFSRFIDDLTRYDWIELLEQAVQDGPESTQVPESKGR